MKINAHTTIPELAGAIGVTERSVERTIKTSRQQGRIRLIGPPKGGYWEVIQ